MKLMIKNNKIIVTKRVFALGVNLNGSILNVNYTNKVHMYKFSELHKVKIT